MSPKVVKSRHGLLGVEDKAAAIYPQRKIKLFVPGTDIAWEVSISTIGTYFRHDGILSCRGYLDNHDTMAVLKEAEISDLKGQWL